jgi:hypothetical protein
MVSELNPIAMRAHHSVICAPLSLGVGSGKINGRITSTH